MCGNIYSIVFSSMSHSATFHKAVTDAVRACATDDVVVVTAHNAVIEAGENLAAQKLKIELKKLNFDPNPSDIRARMSTNEVIREAARPRLALCIQNTTSKHKPNNLPNTQDTELVERGLVRCGFQVTKVMTEGTIRC